MSVSVRESVIIEWVCVGVCGCVRMGVFGAVEGPLHLGIKRKVAALGLPKCHRVN